MSSLATQAPGFLRQQLEFLAAAGHEPSRFILRWGKPGGGAALPKGIKPGRLGQCYANAGRLATLDDRLVYCEGLALRAGLPFGLEHAWLMDAATGAFIDPTWPEAGGEYFGVPFTNGYLNRTILKTERWGLIGNGRPPPEDPAEFLFHLKAEG